MSPTCTLETKSGQLRQQRHCLVEILATADSLGQSRSGNCTLRASLTQGTGCFQFLGYPDSLGGFPQGSSDKALTDCKLESKVLMSPTCENGRQTSANNAQIFSPRQKQTLSKRGPQLSTWQYRQNSWRLWRQKWPAEAEAMRFENLATADSLGQKRSGNCTLRASLTQGTGCFHFLGSPAFCGGFPYAKGASDKALTANEERGF